MGDLKNKNECFTLNDNKTVDSPLQVNKQRLRKVTWQLKTKPASGTV